MTSQSQGSAGGDPQLGQAVGKKPIFQINSCFICNLVFVADRAIGESGSVTGVKMMENLCAILEVRIVEMMVPECNPLCTKCSGMIDEYFALERQLQFLVKMLWELRKMLGKRVVDGYKDTNLSRKNFAMKKQIFEAWSNRMDSCPPVMTGVKMHNINLAATGNDPCNASIPKAKPTLISTFSQKQKSTPPAAPLPAVDNNPDPSYVLLDISNNKSASTSATISQGTESTPGESHQNEFFMPDNGNDNFSMGCPSPSSPVGFDDTGGMSGNEDVYVRNLPANENENAEVRPPGNLAVQGPTMATGENSFSSSSAPAMVPPDIKEAEFVDKRKTRPIVVTRRRTHPCRFCGKLFPSDFAMQMHERIHTGEKPFSCSICSRPFLAKAAMQKHELTHDKSRYEGEPKYECDICGKKYHLKLSMYTHKRDFHMGIKRIKRRKPRVMVNNRLWPPKINYKKKKIKDPNAPPKVKKEPKPRAPRKSRRKIRLDADGNPIVRRKRSPKPPSNRPKRKLLFPRRKRGEPKPPAICTYCGKDFVERYRLQAHLPVHTGEKSLQCPKCDKTFALKGNLDKHMKSIHESQSRYDNEPAHVCDFCGKAFYVLGTLYHHRRKRHLGMEEKYKKKKAEGPIKCKICDKECKSVYALHHHRMRTHQEKRHKCSVCEKPFHTSNEANDHAANRHNPDWLYATYFRHKCVACPEEHLGFGSKLAVREHWAQAHADQTMPERYKKPKKIWKPKPPGPGAIYCMKCPEECRPAYRQLSSLRKHERAYHFPNSTKKWKPNGEKGKGKRKKVEEEEEDEDESSMSDDDYLEESEEFNSDTEKDTKVADVKVEPVRRSGRAARRKTESWAKLLGDSENESDIEDNFKLAIGQAQIKKNPMNARRTTTTTSVDSRRPAMKSSRSKTKWTESYIKKTLKGREMRLVLEKLDKNELPSSQKKLKTSAPSKVSPLPSASKLGRISPSPNPLDVDISTPEPETTEDINVEIRSLPEPEVKEENDQDDEEEEQEELEEVYQPSPVRRTAPATLPFNRNVPLFIHNPLSKSKTTPSAVPPRSSANAGQSANTMGDGDTANNEENSVLGF